MKIEFLIATMNRKDTTFLETMFQHVNIKEIDALIINQCPDIPIPNEITPPHKGIRVISLKEKGTSQNRNTALNFSEGDVCVFLDDDLILYENTMSAIQKAYKQFPDADLITFQTFYVSGKKMRGKGYKEKPHKHHWFSLLKVPDCAITFKRKSIYQSKVKFDPRFGLNNRYPLGEYRLFLLAGYREKLSMYYYPAPLNKHPDVRHSGIAFQPNLEFGRGALFYKMNRFLWPVLNIYFALKNYKGYKNEYSLWDELRYLFSGSCSILFNKN